MILTCNVVSPCRVECTCWTYSIISRVESPSSSLGSSKPSLWRGSTARQVCMEHWEHDWPSSRHLVEDLLDGGLTTDNDRIFFFSLSQWGGVSYGDYKYPPWAEFVGWMFALSSMLFIPGFAIYQILRTPGNLVDVSTFSIVFNLVFMRFIWEFMIGGEFCRELLKILFSDKNY